MHLTNNKTYPGAFICRPLVGVVFRSSTTALQLNPLTEALSGKNASVGSAGYQLKIASKTAYTSSWRIMSSVQKKPPTDRIYQFN